MTITKIGNRQQEKEQFPLGVVVATRRAVAALTQEEMADALLRHQTADWGTVCIADWKENDVAVESGCRILSSYQSGSNVTFWVITEADRSSTTVLLPEEY